MTVSERSNRRNAVRRFPVILILGLWVGSAVCAVAADPYVRDMAGHTDLVRWVGFSPDGKILASTCFDGSIRWTDPSSGRTLRTLKPGTDRQTWGQFSADNRIFVAGSNDPLIRVWNTQTGKLLHTLTASHHASWAGCLLPNAKVLNSGGPEGGLARWDLEAGIEVESFNVGSPIWWLAASPSVDEIAVARADGRVRIVSGKSHERITFGDHRGGVYCVEYSPDGNQIATAGADALVKVWNARTGELRHTFPHFSAVHAVAFSADSKQVASGGADNLIKLWNIETGAFVRKLSGHMDAVWSVDFSPDGSVLASGGGDHKVRLWNLKHLPLHLQPPRELPTAVDLRPRMKNYKLSVVSQRGRNSCSVQTFTRALEFALAKLTERGTRLSDEYLNWACNNVVGNVGADAKDRGQFFEHLWMALCRNGYCTATQMPWRETFDPAFQPSENARQSASRKRPWRLHWHDIGGPGLADEVVVRQIKSVLAAGWPVLAGSSHSVLVVGYINDATNPGGGRFMIADSGTGGFVTQIAADKLHSAITYDRMRDYGFSWLECVSDKTIGADSVPKPSQ